ncbi:MAG: BamA/TamA family outer membrane protein, partial [Gemmatimonadetes bacterium]|nr:BamA/TamA family outer membrane protein [Gemmatimonadota bacterium]
SYQSISNLGYFAQPLPTPDTRPVNDQGDVDIIFRVEEKRTGAVNFGASLGQGTGLGGFIGLQEPNLFGRGKRVQFQWQFGKNINDFQISYTDPSIRGSLFSGTLTLHNSRLRYTVADLGQIRTQGGTIQLGIPVFGSRYTRLFTAYTLEESNYDTPNLVSRFRCRNCVLSALGATIQRDTRIGLPFATGGALQQLELSQNGGILQGSGNFRRANLEGRWYAPLAQLGGQGVLGGGIQFLLGFTAKSGFVWGNPGPHFRQLFALGGTQFGIPLRGYDEFSITPRGFDPNASTTGATTVDAFGESYFSATGEIGMRVSQMVYLSGFFDAGNVWATPRQYNPTRLFRSSGIGVSVVSPLGPLGIDIARGFDRTDQFGNRKPGWKVHFRLGQFF